MKTFVQHLAGLLDSEKDAVIDVKELLEVAQELARENRRFYPLEAALQRHTDMQGDAALAFLLVCKPFLDRLLAKGYERSFVILEAVGMGLSASDMPGLTSVERTRRLELIRSMLSYNVIGEALFVPGVGEDGVRSTGFQGLAAPNLLAFLANADSRAAIRDRHPVMYREMVDAVLSQKHVESYHSELAQQLGYKPSIRMLEPRARKVTPPSAPPPIPAPPPSRPVASRGGSVSPSSHMGRSRFARQVDWCNLQRHDPERTFDLAGTKRKYGVVQHAR